MTHPYAELRDALEKATDGPFFSAGGYLTRRDPSSWSFVHSIYDTDELGQSRPYLPFQAIPFARWEDAAFIALALNELPRLLADYDRMREALADLEAFANEQRSNTGLLMTNPPQSAAAWNIKNEIARARAALQGKDE